MESEMQDVLQELQTAIEVWDSLFILYNFFHTEIWKKGVNSKELIPFLSLQQKSVIPTLFLALSQL